MNFNVYPKEDPCIGNNSPGICFLYQRINITIILPDKLLDLLTDERYNLKICFILDKVKSEHPELVDIALKSLLHFHQHTSVRLLSLPGELLRRHREIV